MEQIVERLLGDYEGGRLTRRQLIRAVAAAATITPGTAATGFHGVSLNHVTFRVSDVQRSSRFYRDLAGLRIREQKPRAQILAMDQSFLVLSQSQTAPPGVDHFCIAVKDFDLKAAAASLKEQGLHPEVNARGELYVPDPDGLRVQISSEDYAGQLP